jgi:PKD repeat protein
VVLVAALALVLFPTLTGAAPSEAPIVANGTATGITSTAATLNGTVDTNDPDGIEKADFYFRYWRDGDNPSTATQTPTQSVAQGTGAHSVQAGINGLSPSTMYDFKVCAVNSAVTTETCDETASSFTTSAVPSVSTGAASNVTSTGATLAGSVNPNGDETSYKFYYGTSHATGTSYPNSTALVSAGSGTSSISASQSISGLAGSTTYYFRLCATNVNGTVCGTGEGTFATPSAPTATTGAASSVTRTSALLAGSVDPNGDASAWTFVYGASHGNANGTGYATSSPGGSTGAGTSPVAVSESVSSGITGNTTYFFRLCATNTYGTNCGNEGSFLTPDAPTSATGSPVTGLSISGATLPGTVNPNGATVSSTFFKYGTSSSYGQQVSASPGPGSGRSPVSVSATLSGLASGTTFHYTLCATNTFGTNCDPSDHTFVTNQPPTAALAADKTSGPNPLTVTFDGSASTDSGGGSIQSWQLSFGDGQSTAVTAGPPTLPIVHTYANAGNYSAVLTVTDNQGASDPSTPIAIHVTANLAPLARLSATPTAGTVPLDVSFNGSTSADPDSIPLKSWTLDFLDGTTPASGTGPVPSAIPHQYTVPGTYNAKLTVTDSSNASAFTTVAVTVNPLPTITIADKTVTEGQPADFFITLSAPSTHDITVNYTTVDGTATAGTGDYTPVQGTLTIAAGSCGPATTVCKVTVQTTDDSISESDETFTVKLSSPQGATLAKDTGLGKILDNDPMPTIAMGNAARIEGKLGQTPAMVFTVYLCNANPLPTSFDVCQPATSGQVVTAKFSTFDGSANDPAHTRVRDGVDYIGKTGTVTFNPGQTQAQISVNVIGNNTPQAALRWFLVDLSNPVGASIDTLTLPATGTIIDDDPATPAPPPIAATGDASNIGLNQATVVGTVNPNGLHTNAWLEYGPIADPYTFRIPPAAPGGQPQHYIDVGSDSSLHTLSFTLTGLTQGTTYHYRIFALNDDHSTAMGDDRTLVTSVPVVPPPPTTTAPVITIPPQTETTKTPPPKVPMSATLKTRTATPTAKGWITLKFSCKGTAAKRCLVNVFIDFNGTPVAKGRFSLLPGKQGAARLTTVRVKINPRMLKLLLLKKKLRVDVGYSYGNGLQEFQSDDKGLMLVAPKKVPPATKRK